MNIKEVLTAEYDRENWKNLLCHIFKSKAIIYELPSPIEVSGELAKKAFQLGEIKLADSEMLAVYEVELSDHVDIVRNRRGIRDMLTSDWRDKGFVGAFVLSSRKKESILRFSYVSENFDFNEEGEYIKKSTAPKRFTYLLGEEYSCRTAAEQFETLKKSKQTLADVTEAFSVEVLSNEFFKRYKVHYRKFVDYMCKTPKIFNEFVEVSKTIHKGDTEKAIRDFVKRQLGRIVFLHFLQKKGWLGVPKDKEWGCGCKQFMKHLFEKASDSQKDNFLSSVLVPLYRDALDTDRGNADDLFNTGVDGIGEVRIPYLNGGLFECDTLDEHEWKMPKNLFDELLEMFAEYNFTIDENDPDDAEVGVDPEMLGRIFENLLEDNKDKGAYYTPKEIVQYMCRESLIAYLQTDIKEDDKEKVRTFVTEHNAEVLGALKETINQKLKGVKICDPAIGSGAFPMGLLRELFYCRTAIEPETVEKAAEIKREIIQNNIYGVDIEAGAVEIARLRFWLSLVVDEQSPATLPNLDFKIMQGNSLLEQWHGIDLSNMATDKNVVKYIEPKKNIFGEYEDRQIEFTITKPSDVKELQEILKKYYKEDKRDIKERYREDIRNNIRRQISDNVKMRLFQAERFVGELIKFESKKKKTQKDLIVQQSNVKLYTKLLQEVDKLDVVNADFFLWHMWFPNVFEQGGFDIVIGNPPYIQLQKNKSELGNLYKNCGYETFIKKGDIYCLFYERGYQLLKEGGHLCYITSNTWMRSDFGEHTRGFFAKKTNPKLLLDFAGVKVFDNATVDTNILLFAKATNELRTLSAVASDIDEDIVSNLSYFMEQKGKVYDFPNSDSWHILSPIEEEIKRKIETVGTPLEDWDITINRGVLTSRNRAFFVRTEKRDEILSNCKTEEERKRTENLIRPILQGKDIKRYGYKWADLWLINTHNGLKGKLPRVKIEDYPAVKEWLDNGGVAYNGKIYEGFEVIKNRSDQGDTSYNLRNCAYLEDFDKPKIIYGQFQDSAEYSFDESGMYLSSNEYFIICNNYSAKCLLAFLNSKAIEWLLYNTTGNLGGNSKIAQESNFLKIAIPILDDTTVFDSMVEKRIEGECTDKEIDELVYKFYKLTPEEIEIIEKTTAQK